MEEARAKFIETIDRTPSVKSFRFTLSEKIKFLPGQFLQIIFDEANRDNEKLNKYLSISSSPTKDYIEVTKRISDSKFSKSLLALKPGEKILIKIPMGNCVFLDEYKKIAFLIGGIGITPVISIIEYIIEKKLDTDLDLFYSNRTDNDIAFKNELDYWQSINKNIRVYYTVTDCAPVDRSCLYGLINKDLLTTRACDIGGRMLYIYGPPKMVEAMQALSLEVGCSPDNLKTESFIGY